MRESLGLQHRSLLHMTDPKSQTINPTLPLHGAINLNQCREQMAIL